MVLATAVPAKAPMKLNDAAMRMACCGPEGLRGDRGRDRVRRVVEAVDVVEEDGQRDDDDERERDAFHGVGAASDRVWIGDVCDDMARCGAGCLCSPMVSSRVDSRVAPSRPRRYPSRHAPAPTCSSPPSATIPPTRRCRRTGCCSGPATSASSAPGSTRCCRSASASASASSRSIREEIERDRRPGDGDAGRPPGGALEGERPLLQDRAGDGPVQGPRATATWSWR